MAFFRGVAALCAVRSAEATETPGYAYYSSVSADETPSYDYYGSQHPSLDKTPNYDYYGSKHASANYEIPTCGFQGTVCSFPGGMDGGVSYPGYPGGKDGGHPVNPGEYYPVNPGDPGEYYPVNPGEFYPGYPGGYYPGYPEDTDGYPVNPGGMNGYPMNPGGTEGVYDYPRPGGPCQDPRGCALDGLPGIPLDNAQLALVRKMASQAADGLSTTIQLLQQDRQSGPVGNLFEQIFSETLSKNLRDEEFVQERLQDVLDMMTAHPDRVEYVYCTEGETDYDCPENQGVVAYVLSGGKFGETDMTKFSVHLGKIWWNDREDWGEGCKAGILIHEYTHHVFHTLDLGYNFEGKALTDEEKLQNAASYQNLVVEVMVARQKNEL